MQKLKRRAPDMLNGPLLKNIILYSIPIILTGLLQLAFNAADLMVVGQFCGDIAIAAVGNTGSIIALIVNLFMGLSVGIGVTVAQAIGADDKEAIHKSVHTAIPTALICGLVVSAVGIIFCEEFLTLMDTPITVLPYSAKYMRIYFYGTVFIMLYNFCAAILRAAGDTRSPLIFLIIAGVINVLLNVIFVTQFGMDVDGVAWATTISQAISAILVVIALIRRKDACKLLLTKIRIYLEPLAKMLKIGIPAGIQSSLFAIANVIIQSSINSFGPVIMAGSAASSNIESFTSTIIGSFHQAALNFIGQNVGANNFKRVKKIFITCLICGFVGTVALCGIIYLVGPLWLSVYIPDSPEALDWAMTKLGFMCCTFFLCALQDISTGSLRGMGISFAPMIISILSICGVRILWIYTIFRIPQYHTPMSLCVIYAISWGINFIAQTTLFIIAYRKRSQMHPV